MPLFIILPSAIVGYTVGLVQGYGLDSQGIGVQFQADASEMHITFYVVGNGSGFTRGKTTIMYPAHYEYVDL
jgi:hypothetical protein